MLGIYASAFMTATRLDQPQLREMPGKERPKGLRRFRVPPHRPIDGSKL